MTLVLLLPLGILCVLLAVHLLLSHERRGRWLTALLLVPILLFAFFLVGIWVHGKESHEGSVVMRDVLRLKQIGTACWMFAADHGGRFPDDWSLLAPYIDDPTIFVAVESGTHVGPITNVMQWTDFTYCPGITTASAPTAVVAYMPPGHYKRAGTVVLFADGHGEWLSTTDFQKTVQK